MDPEFHSPPCWPSRVPIQRLCQELAQIPQEGTQEELHQRVTEKAHQVLQVVDDYSQDSSELSLLARVKTLQQLDEALTDGPLGQIEDIELLGLAKGVVHTNLQAAENNYQQSYGPVREMGQLVRATFLNTVINSLKEAAFLTVQPIDNWQSKEIDGGLIEQSLESFCRDLRKFKVQLIESNADPLKIFRVDTCLGVLEKALELSLKVSDLETYYVQKRTFVPVPNATTDPNLSLYFDLRQLYELERKGGYNIASPELQYFIDTKIKDIVFQMQSQIQELDREGCLVFPGGFLGTPKLYSGESEDSHANLYHVERVDTAFEEIPRYHLTIIDESHMVEVKSDYHNEFLGQRPIDIDYTHGFDRALHNLTKEQIIDETLLTALVRMQVISNHEVRGPRHIYSTLLESTGRNHFDRGPHHKAPTLTNACSYTCVHFFVKRFLPHKDFYEFHNVVKERVLGDLKEIDRLARNGDPAVVAALNKLKIRDLDQAGNPEVKDGFQLLQKLIQSVSDSIGDDYDSDLSESASDSSSIHTSEISDLDELVTSEEDDSSDHEMESETT